MKEYMLIWRDGEKLVMKIETDVDSFLDFLNDLRGKSFAYKMISKEQYYLLKDQLEIQGYTARKAG